MLRYVSYLLLAVVAMATTAGADSPGDYPYRTLIKSPKPGALFGIPSVCRLKNGEILVVYHHLCSHVCYGIHDQEWFDCYKARYSALSKKCPLPHKGRLEGIRSADDGKTWSAPFIVVDGPHSESDPQISTAPDGTVHLVYLTRYWTRCGEFWTQPHPQSPYPRYPRYFAIAMTRSTDHGRTWTKPHVLPSIYEHRDSAHDPIRFAPDGTYLLAIQGNPFLGPESGMILASHDQGDSWTVRGTIDHPTESISEHAISLLGEEKIICAMRPGPFISYSNNAGRSWTVPKLLPGGPEKAPFFLLTSNNELLLFEYTRRGDYGFTVRISLDDGQTLTDPLPIDPTAGNPHGHAIELNDGTILAVYYSEYDLQGDIRAARFRVTDKSIERLAIE